MSSFVMSSFVMSSFVMSLGCTSLIGATTCRCLMMTTGLASSVTATLWRMMGSSLWRMMGSSLWGTSLVGATTSWCLMMATGLATAITACCRMSGRVTSTVALGRRSVNWLRYVYSGCSVCSYWLRSKNWATSVTSTSFQIQIYKFDFFFLKF